MALFDNADPGDNEWHLGRAILAITHRWDLIILFILLGALLGWGVASIWPSPYRATSNLYVGLNAYRFQDDGLAASLSGQPFRLVDDYKNWQMEQLNDLILTEVFINDTLNLLRESDPYWQNITSEEFRQMAKALWRNPGEWHLVIQASQAQKALQAVEAWERVILARVDQALVHARQVVSLEIEMNRLSGSRFELEKRQEQLAYLREQLIIQIDDLHSLTGDTVVSPWQYSAIQVTVSAAANWQPAWDRLLDDAPPIGADAEDLLPWVENVCALIDLELGLIPLHIMNLDEEFTFLSDQYQQEAADSLGLAATLFIEGDLEEAPVVHLVRPTGTLSLIGSLLGLLAWLFWAILSVHNWKHSG